ncbi:hypothetical protein HQ524_04535 [Candidatus Uhrbacteria bacterium]|nr:hypothetical protein [Candidatus Uhrbacteria bacterium]
MFRNIYYNLVAAYIGFMALAITLNAHVTSDVIDVVLTIATFTFAIFLAFSVSIQSNRLNNIRKLLRASDAHLLTLYLLSKQLGVATQSRCRKMIDELLVTQIDYKLHDIEYTTHKVVELQQFVFSIKPKNERQSTLFSSMISSANDIMEGHKDLIHSVNNKVLPIEWGVLTVLSLVIWFCLYSLNDGTTFALVVIPLLSTAFLLLLLILREMNSLRWQEKHWDWDPLISLFKELALKPYFPAPVFTEKRLTKKDIKEIGPYRVATYPKPYPDFTGKKVKTIKQK